MDKVRIGIIGGGFMAQMAHLPSLAAIPEADVVALCDPRRQAAEALAAKWDIGRVTTSAEELVGMDLDAVLVLTPVEWHRHHITLALEAGRHVFTEKPITLSAASGDSLKALAHEKRRTVMVGYMKRHEYNLAAALDDVAERDFGQPLFLRCHSFIGADWDARVTQLYHLIGSEESKEAGDGDRDHGPQWLDQPRDDAFYSFKNPFYALLDTGCHTVNLMRYLAGRTPDVLSAECKRGTRLATFDFGDFLGTMEFAVNFDVHRWDEVGELYLERGALKVFTPQPTFTQAAAKVEIYSERGNVHSFCTYGENNDWAFLRQMKAFVTAVRNDAVDHGAIADAQQDVAVMERIYQLESR